MRSSLPPFSHPPLPLSPTLPFPMNRRLLYPYVVIVVLVVVLLIFG